MISVHPWLKDVGAALLAGNMVLADEEPREDRQFQVAETETLDAPAVVADESVAATGRPRRKYAIRVGDEYQAEVPDTLSANDCGPDKAILVWAPCNGVPDSTLEEYTALANYKYGFSMEQALGLLFFHDYDVSKATSDLENFVPTADEYSPYDWTMFENAFDIYNKNFRRIQRLLPHKTISSLVNHYYLWKQTRMRASLLDWHAHRLPGATSGSDSGKDCLAAEKPASSSGTCTNCLATMNRLRISSWGNLCSCCLEHMTRVNGHEKAAAATEYSKPRSAKCTKATRARRQRMLPIQFKPEDIETLRAAALEEGQGGTVLGALDRDIVDLRKQVQKNKQLISQLPHITCTSIDAFRPPKTNVRPSPRWTQNELFITVQAIRKYGHDCSAIAAVIGNKTEAHVRELLAGDCDLIRLVDIAQEFDAAYGISAVQKDDGEVECVILD